MAVLASARAGVPQLTLPAMRETGLSQHSYGYSHYYYYYDDPDDNICDCCNHCCYDPFVHKSMTRERHAPYGSRRSVVINCNSNHHQPLCACTGTTTATLITLIAPPAML